MKNAIQIVLTFSLAFGVVGCDQYWHQIAAPSGLPANTGRVTVARPLPLPPGPTSPAAAVDRFKSGSAEKCRDGEHEIGERWKDDCNECWCQSDGSVACTRMLCS